MMTRSSVSVALVAGLLAMLVLPMTARATTVIVDTFDGALNPMWQVDDEPASYGAGGGYLKAADHIRFNSVAINSYAHIETANTVDTTAGIRADAIMRQDHYPVSTWGMGVSIYFDQGNWVSIKQGAAGNQNGWMKQGQLNGVYFDGYSTAVNTLRTIFLISGLELTDTQIKFYGSSITPMVDHYGVTDIDPQMTELTELTMARPTGFTGQAKVIIGKGYSTPTSYSYPDFDNSAGTPGGFAFAGIDYARIIVIPEPATICLLIGGAGALLRRRI